MQFETNFENKDLESKKLDLLKKISTDFEKIKCNLKIEVPCFYHEEELTFYSKDSKLKDDFNRILPNSWLTHKIKTPHKIYIFNPIDFGISIEDWALEPSQDCFIDNEIQAAIQRDFISLEINKNETILICYDSMEDGLNNFMRWFLPRRLLKKDKIVFHSSCVIENGKAKVFLGHSGAGKSTMVSLREDREHLSDDINLIFKKNGTFYISAGAIGGLFFDKVDYAKAYPISSFSWLIQSKEDQSTKLTNSKAYLKAMASVSNVFWDSLEESSAVNIMNFVKELSTSIKFYELKFQKNEMVWKYVQ